MEIKVRHITNTGRKIRRKAPVYDALVVPVRKGVWYLDVGFKVRTEVLTYTGDPEHPNRIGIYFETGNDEFTVLELTSEKEEFHVFARMSKSSYRGMIIDKKILNKAIERHCGC